MRAVVINEHGGPEVLRIVTLPIPQPGPGEILVRVRACALNHGLDLRTRQNGAGRRIAFPHVLGCEIAGEIADARSGSGALVPGDHVVVVPWVVCGKCLACQRGRENSCPDKKLVGIDLPGGYSEFVTVPERNVIALPPGKLDPISAATMPITFTTAWHMLKSRGRVQPAETVVVLGAAGGIGLAAVQLAKRLGARVIAVASSADKLKVAMNLGADEGVAYDDFSTTVRDLTGGQGADVVVDHLGAATWQDSLRSLAPDGRLLMCGATTGFDLTFDARQLWRQNISLCFSNSGTNGDLREVIDFAAAGKIRPILGAVLPLEDAAEGHRLIASRQLIGKVVLNVGQ
jgi:NADPH:quinone reductase-like Zn-dependent oxidoreductase